MSVRANQRETSLEGFTLVEMLVVLSILTFAAVFAMPQLSRGSERMRLDTAAHEIAAALRATRAAAMTGSRQMALTIDVERRTFRSGVVQPRSFASDIDAKLTYAAPVRSEPSDGGFQFFPDGSSTGGEVLLSLHGRQTKLCIDWLTGIVRMDAACGRS